MNDALIASIKLVTGEELVCVLVDIVENGRYTSVLIEKPMLLSRTNGRRSAKKSYKLSSWLIVDDPHRDYYELNIDKIIITTVVSNKEILDDYKKCFIPKLKARPKHVANQLESELGYIGTVDEYRKKLEDIYNNDSYRPNN